MGIDYWGDLKEQGNRENEPADQDKLQLDIYDWWLPWGSSWDGWVGRERGIKGHKNSLS